MKTNQKQNLFHLIFSAICIMLIQMTGVASSEMTEAVNTVTPSDISGNPDTIGLIKLGIQAVIGLVHLIVSIRNDKRHKREIEAEVKATSTLRG